MARGKTTGKVEEIKKIWLSKDEAKAFLGCSDDFLLTLRAKAEIKFSKYGNKIWYDLKSLDRFIERNRVI